MLNTRKTWLFLVLLAALGGSATFLLWPKPAPPPKIQPWHLVLADQPPISPYIAARLAKAQITTGHDMSINAPVWLSLANDGNLEAEAIMASLYMAGLGVGKSPEQAAKWYLKSAADGNPESEMTVANAYQGYQNQQAVAGSDDYKKLDSHTQAGINDVTALYNAINALKPPAGSHEQEAALWVRRAADYGLYKAQNDMVGRYLTGTGVPKDVVQAYKWSLILAAGPWGALHDKVSGMLGLDATFARTLTPAQIAEARRQAEDWRPIPIPAPPLPATPDDKPAAANP